MWHAVAADIERYAEVPVDTKAKCVADYVDRLTEGMTHDVCGGCGLRDPSETYVTFDLKDVAAEHWLHVGAIAHARLLATPAMTLLRCGSYEEVSVHQVLLHNIAEVEGHHYHVVPEAVRAGSNVRLCSRCRRCFNVSMHGKQRPDRGVRPLVASDEDPDDAAPCARPPLVDSYDDLYYSNAPPSSIAAGADFGRLSGLAALGIATDVSTLERLVLAEVRCHHIVYKVVAYGHETERQRLHGHSIVCPQKAEPIEGGVQFGMAALLAAFAAVRLVFVGPKGQQGKLERCALKIDDLRLRPDVIFNFLTIFHYLHGGPTPPTLAEVQAVIKEHGGRKRTLRSTRGTCSM